jgi:hypothetical protein
LIEKTLDDDDVGTIAPQKPRRHYEALLAQLPALQVFASRFSRLRHLSPTKQTKLLLTANIGDCLSINI